MIKKFHLTRRCDDWCNSALACVGHRTTNLVVARANHGCGFRALAAAGGGTL